MPTARWTADDIPDLRDRLFVVTGANSGLGYETTRALVHHGAHVIMACRNEAKAQPAAARIEDEQPRGRLEVWLLDLASLASIEAFAERMGEAHEQLHGLCNNAGVMALPYATTVDGFEMQLGTNHLGHFALTGRLLPLLLATEGSRVVTLSSLAHYMGRMRWSDLNGEGRYRKWEAYGQSKLANLLFTMELQRRLAAARARTIAVASHPGYAATNLQLAGARQARAPFRLGVMRFANRVLAQSAAMGALPSLYALTADDVEGGEYYGPDGPLQMWGHPTKVQPRAAAVDPEDGAKLWAVSKSLTGVRYEALSN